MTFLNSKFLCAGVAILMLIACSESSDAASYYSEPAVFDGASFCTTIDRTVPLDIPLEIMEKIEGKDEGAIASALLSKAAMEIAHTSPDDKTCKQAFSDGEALFQTVLAGQRKGLRKAVGYKKAKDKALRPIQAEITRFWREDQSARGVYMGLSTKNKGGAAFWAQRLATAHATRIDARSRVYIDSLLEDYDWFDTKRFGKKVSAHAWIIVQHADEHPEFQAKVLERMKPYLDSGDLKPANYAYLWDRVAVNTGKKQLYGTQPTWECTEDRKLTLQPLEDPDNVNTRRAEMNMVTVEKGLESMAQGVCH